MLDTVFRGLFDSDLTSVISITDFILCMGVSLILGFVMALAYMYRTRYTKSFVITLALLPAVVCVVIMLVNGNVGTGVAVAGAFSLVRFRSVPGTAKEICTLFLAMGAGLTAGMGYLGFAVLFRMIRWGSKLMVCFSASGLEISRSARLAASRPISYVGWLTVVSGTSSISEKSILSKPTMDMSSGTDSPSCLRQW